MPRKVIKRVTSRNTTIEEIRVLAKERNIELISTNYEGLHKKHEWKCQKGHIWMAIPYNIIEKDTKCPDCCTSQKLTIEEARRRAKLRGFEFLSESYYGVETKYKWKCQDGHIWEARAVHVFGGGGCHKCLNTQEEKSRFIFEQLTGKKFPSTRRALGNRLELDGYCKKFKLAFEYNGPQHYAFVKRFHRTEIGFDKQQKRDKLKAQLCEEKGIIKIDISCLVVRTDEQLENFIQQSLKQHGIGTPGTVDWSKFNGSRSKIKEIQEIAKKGSFECISKTYLGGHTNLDFKCTKCGHKWRAWPTNIRRGTGCRKCNSGTKEVIKIQEIAGRYGLSLMLNKYEQNKIKYEWQCKNNHIWWASFNQVTKRKHCPFCHAEDKRKRMLEKMKILAKLRGFKFLSTEYINCHTKRLWQCPKDHIWEATPNCVKIGTGCPRCAIENRVNKKCHTKIELFHSP